MTIAKDILEERRNYAPDKKRDSRVYRTLEYNPSPELNMTTTDVSTAYGPENPKCRNTLNTSCNSVVNSLGMAPTRRGLLGKHTSLPPPI